MNTPKSEKLLRHEESFNTISHLFGILIAIACLVLLIVFSTHNGTPLKTTCYSIFGATMIMLYAASTIFHGTKDPIKKEKRNKLDHSMIYVLIAGTYTPLSLTVLGGAFGWVIFGIIWAIAIFGVIYKVFFYSGTPIERKISALLYLLMGWLIVIAIVPLIKHAESATLWYLLAGGICYSVGVIFYLWDRLPYAHGIFHIFILGGSICHFLCFLVTVL